MLLHGLMHPAYGNRSRFLLFLLGEKKSASYLFYYIVDDSKRAPPIFDSSFHCVA